MSSMPFVVVVQGGAAVGKTTLARRLANDLQIGLLSKDDIKEALFDTLKISSREESRLLGIAVSRSLYEFMGQMIATGRDLVVESVFNNSFADNEFELMRSKHDANFIQIYCYTDDSTRERRFLERIESHTRNPRHFDSIEDFRGSSRLAHGPLAINPVIKVDMTEFDDSDYASLLLELKELMVKSA